LCRAKGVGPGVAKALAQREELRQLAAGIERDKQLMALLECGLPH
jgi:hypothetical protein